VSRTLVDRAANFSQVVGKNQTAFIEIKHTASITAGLQSLARKGESDSKTEGCEDLTGAHLHLDSYSNFSNSRQQTKVTTVEKDKNGFIFHFSFFIF
jgi:hypothetical protein